MAPALVIAASIFFRLRTIPASAIRLVMSFAAYPATLSMSKLSNA